MPFKTKKQRGWMFAHEPQIALKWVHKYGWESEEEKKRKGKPRKRKKK